MFTLKLHLCLKIKIILTWTWFNIATKKYGSNYTHMPHNGTDVLTYAYIGTEHCKVTQTRTANGIIWTTW